MNRDVAAVLSAVGGDAGIVVDPRQTSLRYHDRTPYAQMRRLLAQASGSGNQFMSAFYEHPDSLKQSLLTTQSGLDPDDVPHAVLWLARHAEAVAVRSRRWSSGEITAKVHQKITQNFKDFLVAYAASSSSRQDEEEEEDSGSDSDKDVGKLRFELSRLQSAHAMLKSQYRMLYNRYTMAERRAASAVAKYTVSQAALNVVRSKSVI